MALKLRILHRLVLPLVLVTCGIAAVVYGVRYHTVAVEEEKTEEKTIPVPDALGGMPPGWNPGMTAPPGGEAFPFEQFLPPQPRTMKVPVITIITKDEREPTLIHEVTFGGVALLGSGKIRRTYTGEPPALCPT